MGCKADLAANSLGFGKKFNAADRPRPDYHGPREVMQRVLNLETAVGRARVGRCGRVWVGATTLQATACKAEQRPQAWPQRLNRARSAATQKVNIVVATKFSIRAALQVAASGQLRFLVHQHARFET